MVYALVLGTSVERHASSSLALGTKFILQHSLVSCRIVQLAADFVSFTQ
jgi:hypothetical protein